MKKIAYMLAGLLLVAVVLPAKAEIKETSVAMKAVCNWAAGLNLKASEEVISQCAAIGINLSAKPAGAGSLVTGAIMKAFYAARDNAQKAWEDYLAAHADRGALERKLKDAENYEDLLNAAANMEKKAEDYDKKADEIKAKYEKEAEDLSAKAAESEQKMADIKQKYADMAQESIKKAEDHEAKAQEIKDKLMKEVNDLRAKADQLEKDGKYEEAAKVRKEADAKEAGIKDDKDYVSAMNAAEKYRKDAETTAEEYKKDKDYLNAGKDAQAARDKAASVLAESTTNKDYVYASSTAEKYHTQAAQYTARAEAVEDIHGNEAAYNQLKQEIETARTTEKEAEQAYNEAVQEAQEAAKDAGADYVSPKDEYYGAPKDEKDNPDKKTEDVNIKA